MVDLSSCGCLDGVTAQKLEGEFVTVYIAGATQIWKMEIFSISLSLLLQTDAVQEALMEGHMYQSGRLQYMQVMFAFAYVPVWLPSVCARHVRFCDYASLAVCACGLNQPLSLVCQGDRGRQVDFGLRSAVNPLHPLKCTVWCACSVHCFPGGVCIGFFVVVQVNENPF